MKVLDITGNPFSKVLNNGKTHEALFSTFESDNLCQLYVRPVLNEFIDFEYCKSYFCISDWDVLNRLLYRSKSCGSEVKHKTSKSMDDQSANYFFVKRIKFISANGLLGVVRDLLWSTNVWKTNDLEEWLNKERPDVIFLDGGGDCYIYNIGLYISKKYRIPIVSYFTDDYFLYPKRNSIFKKLHLSKLENKLRDVVQRSSICYAIGEKMAEEYGNYFGCNFHYIMNSIDVKPLRFKELNNNKINISYFGNLGLKRGEMILRLGKILKGKVEINIYSFEISDYLKREYEEHGIIYKGGVMGSEFEAALERSDILLHVESDDCTNRSFTKLAVSTKIPEYMMSGKVILAYGPKELASMELIYKNGIGIYIDSEKNDFDVENLISSLYDVQFREKLIRKTYEYATAFFDREKNSSLLKEKIVECIND